MYTDSLLTANGCDSIIHLDLTVFETFDSTIIASICEGDSVIIGNNTYTTTGIFTDSLQNQAGCDSTIVLDLTVHPVYDTTLIEEICFGESFNIDTITYDSTGIYVDTLLSAFGCDSVVHLDLTVHPVYDTTLNVQICIGDTLYVGSTAYFENGSYTESLQSQFNCDSIVHLNLAVIEKFDTTIVAAICEGDSIMMGMNFFNATGIYTDSLQSQTGCDSTVVLDLTVHSVYDSTLVESICAGDSIIIGTSVYDSTGIYTDSLMSQFGCDSIITLDLTVHPIYDSTLVHLMCAGDSITVGSNIYFNTGMYVDSLLTANGCDSIIHLDLTVFETFDSTIVASICEGDSVMVGGNVYSTTGIYSDSLMNQAGCDSTIVLDLTVYPIYDTTLVVNLCEGDSMIIGSSVYDSTGIYLDSLQSVFGCDSIVHLDLTVHPNYEMNRVEQICEGAVSYTHLTLPTICSV